MTSAVGPCPLPPRTGWGGAAESRPVPPRPAAYIGDDVGVAPDHIGSGRGHFRIFPRVPPSPFVDEAAD